MFNCTCRKFEEELTELINNCGLTVAQAYYIVQNAALKLEIIYNELARQEATGERETEGADSTEVGGGSINFSPEGEKGEINE